MPRIRASWLIVIIIVVLFPAVPALRQQTMDQLRAWPFSLDSAYWQSLLSPEPGPGSQSEMEDLEGYARAAMRFAGRQRPPDPRMLTAAAALGLRPAFISGESFHAGTVSMLRDAAEAGGGPMAWAAYSAALLTQCDYNRIGEQPVDPSDPAQVADAEANLRAWGRKALKQQQAEPVLAALHRWQAGDPQNGLPVALETWVCYGLGQEDKALSRWEEAARLPVLSTHAVEVVRDARDLLRQTGLPPPEASVASWDAGVIADLLVSSYLFRSARVAEYEGLLAMMQGRAAEAIRWWSATATIGRRLQEHPETVVDVLRGASIEAVGVHPSWRWLPDKTTNTSGGPLRAGRLWYGKYHAFYVGQVGERADAELRDSVARSKVRQQLLHEYYQRHPGPNLYALPNADWLLQHFAPVAAQLTLLLFVFALLSLRSPKDADAATLLRFRWLPPIILFAAFWSLVFSGSGWDTGVLLAVRTAVPLLVLCGLALLAARFSRRPGARLAAAWRGNLRRLLPPTVALGAIVCLGVSLVVMGIRVRMSSQLQSNEMSRVIQAIGPSWTNPTIPPDSWRAEYAPKK